MESKSRLRARIRSIRGRTYSTTAPAESRITSSLHSDDGSVVVELSYNQVGEPMILIQCSPAAHTLVTERVFYGTLDEFKMKLTAAGDTNA